MQNLFIDTAALLAQVEYSYSDTSQGQAPGPVFWICWLAFAVLMIAALWKVFSKAGHPGWAAIIPIVNTYFLCKVAGRPGWWIILIFIPFVNFIIWIILCIDVAKNFGKGAGFGIGLLLLPFIFFPILGFGSAQYQGPSASAGVAVSPPPQPA
jgi:ABC-type sulfate transport system permease subunit